MKELDITIPRRPSSLNFDNEKVLLTPPHQLQSRRRRILRRVKPSGRSPFQFSELTYFIIASSNLNMRHRITVLLSHTNHCITFVYQQLMLFNYFRLWFYLISAIPRYFNWANGWSMVNGYATALRLILNHFHFLFSILKLNLNTKSFLNSHRNVRPHEVYGIVKVPVFLTGGSHAGQHGAIYCSAITWFLYFQLMK